MNPIPSIEQTLVQAQRTLKRHLPLYTHSAAKSFRACPALYHFEYILGYRPAYEAEALAFGTLGHRGLEAWWRAAQSNPGEPDIWIQAALAQIAQDQDPFRRASAEALMFGYHARWSDMTYEGKPIRVVQVEAQFEGPLVNPHTGKPSKTWKRGGKIDVVLEIDSKIIFGEHKFSSEDFSAGSPYRRALTLDPQVSIYHQGARILGHEPAGCLYDVIGKPSFKPKKATPRAVRRYRKADGKLDARQRETDETPEEYQERVIASIQEEPDSYFARFMIVRMADEEVRAARNDWQIAGQIRDAMKADRWPMNVDSCGRYGRSCDFLPVCCGEATLEDGTRYRKAKGQHEELMSQEAPPAAAE